MANEKRLIDAAELDRKLEAIAKRYYEQGRMEAAKDYSFVQTVLLSAPTVDAVEVVRCKDCVNYCGFEHCKNGICDVDSVSKRAVYPYPAANIHFMLQIL